MKKHFLFWFMLLVLGTYTFFNAQAREETKKEMGKPALKPVYDALTKKMFQEIKEIRKKSKQEEITVTQQLVDNVLDIRLDLPFIPTKEELEQIKTIRAKAALPSPAAEIAGLCENRSLWAKLFSKHNPSLRSESWGKRLWQFAANNARDLLVADEIRKKYLVTKSYIVKYTLEGHKKTVLCIAIAANGNIVTGSNDKTAKIWDPNTGQCLRTLTVHTDVVFGAAIAANGNIVTGSKDSTAKIWDSNTGQCLQTLTDHRGAVLCIAIAANGNIVTGSEDKTAKIWDPNTGQCLRTLTGHTDWVRGVAIAANGNIVTGSDNSTAKIWDSNTGQCLQTLTGHRGAVSCIAIAANGNIVTGSNDKTAKIWDPNTGQCLRTLTGHTAGVSCIAIAANGNIVTGSEDTTVKIWGPVGRLTTMQAALVAKLFDLKDKNQRIRLHPEWQAVFKGLPDVEKAVFEGLYKSIVK